MTTQHSASKRESEKTREYWEIELKSLNHTTLRLMIFRERALGIPATDHPIDSFLSKLRKQASNMSWLQSEWQHYSFETTFSMETMKTFAEPVHLRRSEAKLLLGLVEAEAEVDERVQQELKHLPVPIEFFGVANANVRAVSLRRHRQLLLPRKFQLRSPLLLQMITIVYVVAKNIVVVVVGEIFNNLTPNDSTLIIIILIQQSCETHETKRTNLRSLLDDFPTIVQHFWLCTSLTYDMHDDLRHHRLACLSYALWCLFSSSMFNGLFFFISTSYCAHSHIWKINDVPVKFWHRNPMAFSCLSQCTPTENFASRLKL